MFPNDRTAGRHSFELNGAEKVARPPKKKKDLMNANESPDQRAAANSVIVPQMTRITQMCFLPPSLYNPLMRKRRRAATTAAAACGCGLLSRRADGRYFELQYPINGMKRGSPPQRPH